ncbi:TonB-dependent receptor [Flavobacterium sp. '19STA2R22 D10 B1']|uniref:TonB-dependent receptor n=1 Tax=Flavobacterium aerium TaxID=3037261 RepID=UPI00278BD938|nr:TonB-dependent receptor [Flavobacterium sp. '19STA2R22 D10 B1']
MKIFTNLFLVLLALSSSLAFSQKGNIRGSISDNQFPLPGATIVVVQSQQNTVSDFDGNFTLTSIKEGKHEIIISFIGYESKTISINVIANKTIELPRVILSQSAVSINEVLVTSSARNSESRALNMQKNSTKIVNIIAANGIGKLPDINAAETVQRIAGVSIEKDQGEGRFVAVRGLPAEWSSTTINGNRLPTAEEETTSRATAFDFFPTELIGYVEVAKAITPDMEADAIGGSVNFITKTAPLKRTLSANLSSGYNDKAGKGTYNGSITYGDVSNNKKWGFIVNGAYVNRAWSTDNFEARRSGDEGIYRLELRDYNGVRQTIGLNGAVDFTPNANNKFFSRLIYGTLNDDETHYKHRVRFDKYNATNQTGRVELQNIHNRLITELYGGEAGGSHIIDKLKVDWKVASYQNSFRYGDIPDKENNSYFVMKFNQDGVPFNPAYLQNRGVGPRAYFKVDGGEMDPNDTKSMFGFFGNGFSKLDATKMKFSELEFYKVEVVERDNIVANIDLSYEATDQLLLKIGSNFRDKYRNSVFGDYFYSWQGANTPYLSDLNPNLINQPRGDQYLAEMKATIGSVFDKVLSKEGMNAFWNNNKNNLILNSDSEILEKGGGLGRNFTVKEQHFSAYAMGTYTVDEQWTFITGLRATNTSSKVEGYEYNASTQVLSGIKQSKNYLSLLPSLHIKYSPTDLTNIRFAVTRTFARPDFGFISPGGTYIEADNEFKGGNPQLNPTHSWNFDLLGEHYFDNVGVMSAGVFYKAISDPIFKSTQQGEYNGRSGVEMSIPMNGKDAYLVGAEFAFVKKFDFLPGFWSNFGVNTNLTIMHSEMTIPDREDKVTIPRQANSLVNAQLFYENGRVNARAAFNTKGSYITEHGTNTSNDIYYGRYTTLDFSASLKINDNLTLFTELNNLLNEPLTYYYGSTDRPKQVEYYGVRGQIGIKWNL